MKNEKHELIHHHAIKFFSAYPTVYRIYIYIFTCILADFPGPNLDQSKMDPSRAKPRKAGKQGTAGGLATELGPASLKELR